MNIAFFTVNRVSPTVGGVDRVTFNLTNSLSKRGHKIFNFFYYGDDDGERNFRIPKHDASDDAAKRIDEIVNKQGIDILIDQYGFDESQTHIRIKSDVRIIRCIHTTTEATGHDTERLLGNFNFFNLKESLYNLLFWINTPRRNYLHQKKLYERSLGVDKFILLDDGYGLPNNVEKKIIGAIPNGFPQVDYAYSPKKKQLLFVGRLVHNQKNTRFVMQLWKSLFREFSDWELVICGDGPDMPVMKAYAKRHRLERVIFNGRVDPSPYYKDASILLLPSFYEGFPMVMPEAMQYGCVPIVYDVVTAYHKICEDKNRPEADGTPRICGSIVKAMDKKAYINECKRLMTDERQREKMALAALEHVKDYDLERITDQWEKLFNDLTQAN
ncbi:MAG: glycosyltransferase [Clostridium sp.]|nr:glycosyltransferase [Clostridium sp.]